MKSHAGRAHRAATPPAKATSQRASTASASTEPQALVVTYAFDPGESGEPYSATVKFTGRRAGVSGKPGPGDTFTREQHLANVVPGSGPITVTWTEYGVQAGEWSVSAALERKDPSAHARTGRGSRRDESEPLASASWSWRRRDLVLGGRVSLVKTRWAVTAPLAMRPAVLIGSLPLLLVIGAIFGITLLITLLDADRIDVRGPLVITALASLAGLVAAKVWYRVLNPGSRLLSTGWAVDGYLIVTPIAALVLLFATAVPVGPYLDAAAPALFTTVAFGRVGCFLTGCCSGRMTRSRWGVWSSSGTVGARRIPAQLIESAIGAVIAVVSTFLVAANVLPIAGAVFVLAMGSYLMARTALLRVRSEPRKFLWQRTRGTTAAV